MLGPTSAGYTTMKQTVHRWVDEISAFATGFAEQLDQMSSINQMIEAMLLGYFELKMDPTGFQPWGVGSYEIEEGGELVLAVAVLLVGDVESASYKKLDRTKRGWTGLSKDQVEEMNKEQFDPPILRECIVDGFAMLE